MRAPQVADFYTAAWPDFTPPLTYLEYVKARFAISILSFMVNSGYRSTNSVCNFTKYFLKISFVGTDIVIVRNLHSCSAKARNTPRSSLAVGYHSRAFTF
jgi:hypothetical protein